jgi:hypothetical protein
MFNTKEKMGGFAGEIATGHRVRIPPRIAHWLEVLGWHKGRKLIIEENPDGSITVRKA